MKKFLLHIASLALMTVLIMSVLDFGYTYVYMNSKPRTKYQVLRSLKNQKFDYAFLGSSRVYNTIMPSIIKERTGKDAINMAFTASHLHDIYTVLKLFKAYHIKTEKIFIQVDNSFNIDGKSNILEYQIIPFLRENEATKAHFKTYSNLPFLYYVPFYRYCLYDQKIGFREVFNNLYGKSTDCADDLGFKAEHDGNGIDNKYALPTKINTRNIIFDSIKKYSANHNIDVIYFCAPYYKETKNLDFVGKLKSKIPELIDYSNAVEDGKMFLDNSHVNDIGARYFTNYLVDDLNRRKIMHPVK